MGKKSWRTATANSIDFSMVSPHTTVLPDNNNNFINKNYYFIKQNKETKDCGIKRKVKSTLYAVCKRAILIHTSGIQQTGVWIQEHIHYHPRHHQIAKIVYQKPVMKVSYPITSIGPQPVPDSDRSSTSIGKTSSNELLQLLSKDR